MKKISLFLLLLLYFISIFFITAAITSCDVNPSKITEKYADKFVNTITYAKDHRTDLCFALIASRKTGDTDQNGLGLSLVPCEKVNHLLSKQ